MSQESYRIGQYLARAGVASRRNTGEFITQGRVKVNGQVVTDLSLRVDPAKDRVEVDGQPLKSPQNQVTLMLNKPVQVLVSRSDPEGRQTVYDLLPKEYAFLAPRLVHIGRLDAMSEGLLLMTTDGELAQLLTHPKHKAEKEYHVLLDRPLAPEEMEKLRTGMDIGGGERTQPCQVEPLGGREAAGYRVILSEGKNRQIRRMMEQLGLRVRRLSRQRIGQVDLGAMPRGAWRVLSAAEVALLRGDDSP